MEERPHKINAEDGQKIVKKMLVDKETNKSSSSSSDNKRSESKDTPDSPDKDAVPDDDSKPGPSSRSSSPEPNCAICLEPLQNKSFTDCCFHTFCFTCLVEWSKVKPECPLCKQQFKSIVHNVQKDLTFDEYHISSRTSNNLWTTIINSSEQRFRYPTTQTHGRYSERSLASYQESYQNQIASHRMRYAPHSVRLYSSSQIISRMPCNFRRRIYNEGLWVKRVSDGRTRLVSPDFYRRNPACTHRLLPWLNRELVALLQDNETQVTFVMELIMALVARYEISSQEFLIHIEPYMGTRTHHFIHELYSFAISPFDMENYDRYADYGLPPASAEQPLIVPSSPDSDVIPIYAITNETPTTSTTPGVLDMSTRDSREQEQANQRLKKLVLKKKGENTWESIITPGPLVHNYTTMHCYFSNPGPSTSSNSYLITEPISSASPSPQRASFSDDEECQVVDVVKPRAERTPEIVDLSSDDENMPSIIDISSDNDNTTVPPIPAAPAIPIGTADKTYYIIRTPRVVVPNGDDSDVECVYQTERTALTAKQLIQLYLTPQEDSKNNQSGSSSSTAGGNEATTSADRDVKRPIVRPWDIPPPGKSFCKGRRHVFRTTTENVAETPETPTPTTSEGSSNSKKLKLTSVVAHFSVNRSETKKESGHRSSHKKHKDKKKKKKKKHLHKHRRRLSSDTESG